MLEGYNEWEREGLFGVPIDLSDSLFPIMSWGQKDISSSGIAKHKLAKVHCNFCLALMHAIYVGKSWSLNVARLIDPLYCSRIASSMFLFHYGFKHTEFLVLHQASVYQVKSKEVTVLAVRLLLDSISHHLAFI